MSKPARQVVLMRQFPGLVLDQDPRDVEAGAAQHQVNVVPTAGQLLARRGLREVSFEETVTDA